MTTVQASPLAMGQRGEIIPDTPKVCPCGMPAAPGQSFVTEWYDRVGLIESYVLIHLCNEHRARVRGMLT